jgi:hypothetical protein
VKSEVLYINHFTKKMILFIRLVTDKVKMELEQRLYRQLFLRRYALLLEKVEHTYKLPPETMDLLRRRILSLDWADAGIEKLGKRLAKQPSS